MMRPSEGEGYRVVSLSVAMCGAVSGRRAFLRGSTWLSRITKDWGKTSKLTRRRYLSLSVYFGRKTTRREAEPRLVKSKVQDKLLDVRPDFTIAFASLSASQSWT